MKPQITFDLRKAVNSLHEVLKHPEYSEENVEILDAEGQTILGSIDFEQGIVDWFYAKAKIANFPMVIVGISAEQAEKILQVVQEVLPWSVLLHVYDPLGSVEPFAILEELHSVLVDEDYEQFKYGYFGTVIQFACKQALKEVNYKLPRPGSRRALRIAREVVDTAEKLSGI